MFVKISVCWARYAGRFFLFSDSIEGEAIPEIFLRLLPLRSKFSFTERSESFIPPGPRVLSLLNRLQYILKKGDDIDHLFFGDEVCSSLTRLRYISTPIGKSMKLIGYINFRHFSSL